MFVSAFDMPADLSGRLGASLAKFDPVDVTAELDCETGQVAPGAALATAWACEALSYGLGGLGAILRAADSDLQDT